VQTSAAKKTLKISNIEFHAIEIPYKIPVQTSDGIVTKAHSIVTKIETSNGLVGVGEAPSEITFSEETVEDMKITLERYLNPLLIGSDPFDLELIHGMMNKAIARHYLAKSTIDFALYDIQGKALKTPACNLLGGRFKERIAVVEGVIGASKHDRTVELVGGFKKKNCKAYKIKIGISSKDDIDRVATVRELAGESVRIGVDANEGYKPDQAIIVIKELERYNVEFVEQPVPAWNLDGMMSIASSVETPIVADESVFSIHDAYNILQHHAADGINLKIHKPGGLYQAKKIASIIEAANASCLIGWGTTGITVASALHLGATIRNLDYACEFNVGMLLIEDDIIQRKFVIEDGAISVPQGVGLGVEIDEEKLKKYEMRVT
jgi:L-alanine-DL-glutamate epimerase-like enolase superfamily enzyme